MSSRTFNLTGAFPAPTPGWRWPSWLSGRPGVSIAGTKTLAPELAGLRAGTLAPHSAALSVRLYSSPLHSWKLWVITLAYTGLWLGLLIAVIVQGSLSHARRRRCLHLAVCLRCCGAVHALLLRRREFVAPSALLPRQ